MYSVIRANRIFCLSLATMNRWGCRKSRHSHYIRVCIIGVSDRTKKLERCQTTDWVSMTEKKVGADSDGGRAKRLRGKLVRYDVRCWRDVTSVFFLRPSALDNSTSRHRRLPVVINRRLECMRGLFASNIAKSSFFGTEKRHASRDRSVVLRPCGRAFRGVGILCTGNHFVVFALHVLEI